MPAFPAIASSAWAARATVPAPTVAILITACDDIEAAVRGYRTLLAGAAIHVRDPSPEIVARARAVGATASLMAPSEPDALAKRFFYEIDADIYLLAAGSDVGDVCVAPALVDKVDAGMDFVGVSRPAAPERDLGDRLLANTVDFLWGRGGDALGSNLKACSRRFALSFRTAAPDAGSAVGLSLHALQLRLPVGEVAALGEAPSRPTPRGVAGWAALLGLVARLLFEERPRRVCGVAALAMAGMGLLTALTAVHVAGGRLQMPICRATWVSCILVGTGAAIAAAGVALDTMAAARQEVKRLGYLAIPRRATDPRHAADRQSSVS